MTQILMVKNRAFFFETFDLVLGQRLSEERLEPVTFRRTATVAESLRLVSKAGPFDPGGRGPDAARRRRGRGGTADQGVEPRRAGGCAELRRVPLRGARGGTDEAIGKETALPDIVAILARLVSGGERTRA